MPVEPSLAWIVLTMGDRPTELAAAIESIRADSPSVRIRVLSNGGGPISAGADAEIVLSTSNLGVPGGRHAATAGLDADIYGFLDDDAVLQVGATERILAAFRGDPDLGAVSLRLVDETGATSRRHIPRLGATDPERSGPVTLFLGGASAFRATAYHAVGGYFTALWYGHEELELGWRLIDGGWGISYLADVHVLHPRTQVSRHQHGWALTGRNRVLIARRTLPWPVALAHVGSWLVIGARRAPGRSARRAYLRGWWKGWREPVDRRPIRWDTVWRLTRLGRPPVV